MVPRSTQFSKCWSAPQRRRVASSAIRALASLMELRLALLILLAWFLHARFCHRLVITLTSCSDCLINLRQVKVRLKLQRAVQHRFATSATGREGKARGAAFGLDLESNRHTARAFEIRDLDREHLLELEKHAVASPAKARSRAEGLGFGAGCTVHLSTSCTAVEGAGCIDASCRFFMSSTTAASFSYFWQGKYADFETCPYELAGFLVEPVIRSSQRCKIW